MWVRVKPKTESKWRTWSSFSARSQSSSSLYKEETSSTEHFFAATRATLSSSRRTSMRVLEPTEFRSRSVFRWSISVLKSLKVSRAGKRLGVLQPEVVKSIRINLDESLVNGSRQNGQTGLSLEDVFSTMFVQQLAQRTCPEKKILRNLRKEDENFKYHRESSEVTCGGHILLRKHRRRTQEREWAFGLPVGHRSEGGTSKKVDVKQGRGEISVASNLAHICKYHGRLNRDA